jgi:transposase
MRPQLGDGRSSAITVNVAAYCGRLSPPRVGGAKLGLVPKPISAGDRTILGKIPKRGNPYLSVHFGQAVWVVHIKPRS